MTWLRWLLWTGLLVNHAALRLVVTVLLGLHLGRLHTVLDLAVHLCERAWEAEVRSQTVRAAIALDGKFAPRLATAKECG